MDNLLRNGIIIDTGILTIHAFSTFEDGRHLAAVKADIPERDIRNFAAILDRLFVTARKVITTPQVLTEFHALARIRAHLNGHGINQLIKSYAEPLIKIEEMPISKDELLSFKWSNSQRKEHWEFCFTDTSLMLASKKSGASVLTLDGKLRKAADNLGIKARNPYYEIYLVER